MAATKSRSTGKSGKGKATGTRKRASAKAAATPTAKATGNGSAVKVTREQLVAFIVKTASAKADAPAKGGTFVQNGSVYLRLEALARFLKVDSPGKLRRAIVEDHGFTRRPFSYAGKGGQTSASYFSRPTKGLTGLGDVPQREARKPAKTGKGTSGNSAAGGGK